MKAGDPRKIAILGVSGNGKTTLARRLSRELGIPRIELDALVHLPDWQEAPTDEVRRKVEDAIAKDAWVIDGNYEAKLGDVRVEIYKRADVVVWLDLSLPRILGRLAHRVTIDLLTNRDLFNGNRQTLRFALFQKDSLFGYAIRSHSRRRREWPAIFAEHKIDVVRLRTPQEVQGWVRSVVVRSTNATDQQVREREEVARSL